MSENRLKSKIRDVKANYDDRYYNLCGKLTVAGLSSSVLCGTVNTVLAEQKDLKDAQSKFTELVDTVGGWVQIAGTIAVIAGLLMFGWGWMRDDAEAKSKAPFVVFGGAIVAIAYPVAKWIAGRS